MLLTFKLASTSFAFWEHFAAVAPFWSPPQDFYRRDNSSWLTPEREYTAALYPKMNPSQRALQVPGAFGRSNDLCGHVCYANHTQKGCCTNNHRTSGQTNHSQEYGGNSFPSLFFWGGGGGSVSVFPESRVMHVCAVSAMQSLPPWGEEAALYHGHPPPLALYHGHPPSARSLPALHRDDDVSNGATLPLPDHGGW